MMPGRKSLIVLFSLVSCINICISKEQNTSLLKNTSVEKSLEEQLESDLELIRLNQYINLDTAFVVLSRAKQLANRQKNKTAIIELDIIESELLCRTNRMDFAFVYANNAKNKSEELGDKICLGNSYLAIANVYISLNDYEEAYDYCLIAENILKKTGDDKGLRKCYAFMGSIYNRTGDPKRASIYFTKALHYAQKMSNDIYIAIACNNLGILSYKTNDYKNGEKFINKAVYLCERDNYAVLLSTIYINLASIMLNTGKADKVMEYCDKVLDIAHRCNLKDASLRAYLMAALYYYSQEEYVKSINNALKTFRLGLDSKNYREIIISANLLSDSYQAIGKLDSCPYYLKYALEYKDSLNIRNNANNLVKLQYEFDNKTREQDARYKMVKIALWISLLILILILFMGIYILKARKKQIKIFELETKSAEIERELDYRNRELASKQMYINKNNRALESLICKLHKVKEDSKDNVVKDIDGVIGELKTFVCCNGLKEFELRFNEVHPEFMKRLNERFPNLTSNEKKLCAYLKLNMSTKEIASLLHVSVNAVVIARYRLRKKMNLNNTDQTIIGFLEQL